MRPKSPPPSQPGVLVRIAAPCAAVLLFAGATRPLLAQDAPAPPPPLRGGLQILRVSGYEVYYSNGAPNIGAGLQPGAGNLSEDIGIGGSLVIDWTKFTDRSTFSLTYTPSYTARVRYSSLDAFNHRLSMNATRKLAPRWTFGFSVAGDYSSIEESLYAPTALGNVAAVPATFNDLAAGILSGNFANNPQLGVALHSSPLLESPVRNLLYGERMFTASVATSLSYSYSPRLTVTLTGNGQRNQHVTESGVPANQDVFVIPNTTSGNAGVAVSYSLSPLTQLTGTVSSTRVSSPLIDNYTTTSIASLGRTFKKRWIVQVHGGVGVTNVVRQVGTIQPVTPHPITGGSLAFKTLSNTLLGSYDRTVSDMYGAGATTSSNASAVWRWQRPGNSWWLENNFTWQSLQGNILTNTSGWQTATSLNRALGSHVVLLTQYAYLRYGGGLLSAYHLSQSSVRLSVVWSPQGNVPR